ncbi:MAG: hypothetical protein WC359_12185 [Dehalococcoidia bacterium]|jgi:hypothetical protein
MIDLTTESRAGITHIAGEKHYIRILWCVLILILAWAGWCVFFLPAGADVTDEGLYCSEAWRFSQGDLPFMDSNAAFGLSFWFASLVFYIFPGCGLLGLRVVWAVFMLLCALATAGILLRYFKPIPSFAAAGVSLIFVSGGAIKVLGYNQMPVLGLLIAVWLWLAACESGGKKQVLLAAGAGIAALLSALCRISLLPVLLFPLVTLCYDALCGARPPGGIKAAIAFMAAFLAGLLCFFLSLYAFDLCGYFLSSLTQTTGIAGHSLREMARYLAYSLLYLLLPALLLSVVILFINYRTALAALRKYPVTGAGVLIVVAALCLVSLIFYFDTLRQEVLWLRGDIYGLLTNPFSRRTWRYSYILIALAFSIVFAAAVRRFIDARGNEKNNGGQPVYRLAAAALFITVLMILGTANYPASGSVRAIAWLPVSMAFCLSWSWIGTRTHKPGKGCRWLIRALFIIVALVYVYCGIAAACFPYRDDYIGRLDSQASSAKLQGIRTTAERARILDGLVAAVEHNSSPGDRILAYENLPMLYFLTDRPPSTNTTWISDFLPGTVKSSILADMIGRERLPELVVRAQYSTHELLWPVVQKPLKRDDSDPIDAFIREHYQVIDTIDGFQIMAPID